jgi:hypothetical protein
VPTHLQDAAVVCEGQHRIRPESQPTPTGTCTRAQVPPVLVSDTNAARMPDSQEPLLLHICLLSVQQTSSGRWTDTARAAR